MNPPLRTFSLLKRFPPAHWANGIRYFTVTGLMHYGGMGKTNTSTSKPSNDYRALGATAAAVELHAYFHMPAKAIKLVSLEDRTDQFVANRNAA